METFRQLDNYVAQPSAVTVGMFDGLHLGHQALIGWLVAEAKARGLQSVVVTFAQHPRAVLSKGNDRVRMLCDDAERLGLIGALGVDRLVVLDFTREFSDLTARRFMSLWLRQKLGARFLLMGYNHRFGSDVLDPQEYAAVAAQEGIEAVRADKISLPGNVKVSSSDVRRALETGNTTLAAAMLGRPYTLAGRVVHGDAIGRTMGIRTANIVPCDELKLIPACGVYAGSVAPGTDGAPIRAVINVGFRPTIGLGQTQRIEAHLIDFDQDLYGTDAIIFFGPRLRDEQRFDSLDSLRRQIEKDILAAREGPLVTAQEFK